jgi:hypothetical protein
MESKLINSLANLVLCEKAYKLNINISSYYVWAIDCTNFNPIPIHEIMIRDYRLIDKQKPIYSAPTSDEVELYITNLVNDKITFEVWREKSILNWYGYIENENEVGHKGKFGKADNIASAYLSYVVWLKETNYL